MSVYTNDIDTPASDDQPEYSAVSQQRHHHRQCLYQYADPEYSADGGYACHGRQSCCFVTKKSAGQSGKILYRTAE